MTVRNDFDPDAPAAPDSGIFGLPHDKKNAKLVLIPVPFDATASYRKGSASGPKSILAASHQVELFDPDLGKPYLTGITMLEESPKIVGLNAKATLSSQPVIDSGGIYDNDTVDKKLMGLAKQTDEYCKQVMEWVYDQTLSLLDNGQIPCVVGGEHSVALGAIKAYAKHSPDLGILHIDAHADLRKAYEGFTYSHASIMYNVLEMIPSLARLVQVGIRDIGEQEYTLFRESNGKIKMYFFSQISASQLNGIPFSTFVENIVEDLPPRVYISFDIDGLDPGLCPSTGTPVPGGLSFGQACFLLSAVAEKKTIVGVDLCEVAPSQLSENEWDGNVGARILYKMLGYLVRSQKAQHLTS